MKWDFPSTCSVKGFCKALNNSVEKNVYLYSKLRFSKTWAEFFHQCKFMTSERLRTLLFAVELELKETFERQQNHLIFKICIFYCWSCCWFHMKIEFVITFSKLIMQQKIFKSSQVSHLCSLNLFSEKSITFKLPQRECFFCV